MKFSFTHFPDEQIEQMCSFGSSSCHTKTEMLQLHCQRNTSHTLSRQRFSVSLRFHVFFCMYIHTLINAPHTCAVQMQPQQAVCMFPPLACNDDALKSPRGSPGPLGLNPINGCCQSHCEGKKNKQKKPTTLHTPTHWARKLAHTHVRRWYTWNTARALILIKKNMWIIAAEHTQEALTGRHLDSQTLGALPERREMSFSQRYLHQCLKNKSTYANGRCLYLARISWNKDSLAWGHTAASTPSFPPSPVLSLFQGYMKTNERE